MMFLTGIMLPFYPAVFGKCEYKPLSRLPQGGEAKTSSNQTLTWKAIIIINRPAPFPHRPLVGFGKGGGIGRTLPSPLSSPVWICIIYRCYNYCVNANFDIKFYRKHGKPLRKSNSNLLNK